MTEWKTIDTAPVDSEFLLVYNGKDIGIGYFHKWSRNSDGKVLGFEDQEMLDRWEWDGEGFEIDPPPTHWMPLPDPPTGDDH